MLKKIPSDKMNVTKTALFFLLQTPTHHSFTFNSQYLYDLKYKTHLSKPMGRTFHFQFSFVFMKVHIFVQLKAWNLTLNRHNSFEN